MPTALWNIWLTLSPWLLLGAVVSGLLHVLFPVSWMQRHLTGRAGVLKAVLLGIPLPLCSCGVIPVGLGLKKNGASDGAAVGFLISTPQTGVDSVLVSSSFLGWPFAALKVAAALVTGLVGGAAADAVATAEHTNTAQSTSPKENRSAAREGLEHALEMVRSIRGWLLAGVLVSAAITWLVPQQSLSQYAMLSGISALLLTLLLSLPLYVCATASVPIAAALVAGGLPPGAALVFLMAGPATNVATIGAIYRTLGGRSLTVYLLTIIGGSLAAGMLFNNWIPADIADAAGHSHGAAWWQISSAIVLAAILLKFFAEDGVRFFKARAARVESAADTMTVAVSGMTCNGCAGRLERSLAGHVQVTSATVSFPDQQAIVVGQISEEELSTAIRAAGFEPGDERPGDETTKQPAGCGKPQV